MCLRQGKGGKKEVGNEKGRRKDGGIGLAPRLIIPAPPLLNAIL